MTGPAWVMDLLLPGEGVDSVTGSLLKPSSMLFPKKIGEIGILIVKGQAKMLDRLTL